ncbi:unnamed protein product [Caretta caretta]
MSPFSDCLQDPAAEVASICEGTLIRLLRWSNVLSPASCNERGPLRDKARHQDVEERHSDNTAFFFAQVPGQCRIENNHKVELQQLTRERKPVFSFLASSNNVL